MFDRRENDQMNENAELFLSRAFEAIAAAAERDVIAPSEIADAALENIPEDRRLPIAHCRKLASMALMLRFSPMEAFDPDRRLVEILDPDFGLAIAAWFGWQADLIAEYALRKFPGQPLPWSPPDLPPAA